MLRRVVTFLGMCTSGYGVDSMQKYKSFITHAAHVYFLIITSLKCNEQLRWREEEKKMQLLTLSFLQPGPDCFLNAVMMS